MRRDPETNPADETELTHEEWEAYEGDMAAAPPDPPPTEAEIADMFRALSEPNPFRG